MGSRITGRIVAHGVGTPGLENVVVNWSVNPPVGSQTAQGELSIPTDLSLTDTEIEAFLRSELAAYLTTYVNYPVDIGVVFTGADVIGCKF